MAEHEVRIRFDDSDPKVRSLLARLESAENHDRWRLVKSLIGNCESTAADEVKGLSVTKIDR